MTTSIISDSLQFLIREQSDPADGYAVHAFLGKPAPLSASDYASSDKAYDALMRIVGKIGGQIGTRSFTNHFPMHAPDGHLQTLVSVPIDVPREAIPLAAERFRRIDIVDEPWLSVVKEICNFGWHSPADDPKSKFGCCTLTPIPSNIIPNGFCFLAYLDNDFPVAESDFKASDKAFADIKILAQKVGATVGQRFHKTTADATYIICPIDVPKSCLQDFAQISDVSRISLWPDLEDLPEHILLKDETRPVNLRTLIKGEPRF